MPRAAAEPTELNRTEPNQTKPNPIEPTEPIDRAQMVTLSARARARIVGCFAQYPRAAAAPRTASRHTTPCHATPRRAAPNGWERKRSELNPAQTDR